MMNQFEAPQEISTSIQDSQKLVSRYTTREAHNLCPRSSSQFSQSVMKRCCQSSSQVSQPLVKKRCCESTPQQVCGLWSLPDDVTMNCLAHVSKLDLAALAMASKSHRSVVVSLYLWNLRWRMGCLEPYLYLCLRISPQQTPRWFIFHPMKRLLKPVPSNMHPPKFYPESSSSFVSAYWGVYVIGGLRNGKPTSDVVFFDCFRHKLYHARSMKMPRAGASASLVDGKIYVFGGCGDEADPSKWAEVFDFPTQTWEFLSVSTPKMPLSIQPSRTVVIDDEEVYALDADGQHLSFSQTKCVFSTNGLSDTKPGYRDDWRYSGTVLFCRASGGRILWSCPDDLDWEEVKGLEELVKYDITKLCVNGPGNFVIFWNVPESLELWSAEISMEQREGTEGPEIWGKVLWSSAVLNLDPPYSVEILYADLVFL